MRFFLTDWEDYLQSLGSCWKESAVLRVALPTGPSLIDILSGLEMMESPIYGRVLCHDVKFFTDELPAR
jgi:hypothetical protein